MKLTIGIFAYNEEQNLSPTVEALMRAAAKQKSLLLEVIIINDGSTDKTESVITDLKNQHSNIHSMTHSQNRGIGISINDITAMASGDKICFIPGDNIFTPYTIEQILINANKADVILHYHVNSEIRKKGRMWLSFIFTFIYKFTYNLQLIYINCLGTYPTSALRNTPTLSRRYNIAAEINVKMLLLGHSYYEMASYMNQSAQKSSALSLRNLLDVCTSFLRVLYEVKTRSRAIYKYKPTRIIDSL